MEKNKVNINIGNQKYTVISSETPEAVTALADTVNEKLNGLLSSSRVSFTEALVLTALDLASEAQANEKEVSRLRNDMAAYLEDVEKVTIERDKLKRELDKLKNKK